MYPYSGPVLKISSLAKSPVMPCASRNSSRKITIHAAERIVTRRRGRRASQQRHEIGARGARPAKEAREARVARADETPEDPKRREHHHEVTEPQVITEIRHSQFVSGVRTRDADHQQPVHDAHRQIPHAPQRALLHWNYLLAGAAGVAAARRGRTRARRWDFDLRQLAALLFVGLRSEEPGDLETLRRQQIGGAAAACSVVGHRHDGATLRNPRRAAARDPWPECSGTRGSHRSCVSSSGRRRSMMSNSFGLVSNCSNSARVSSCASAFGLAAAAGLRRPGSAGSRRMRTSRCSQRPGSTIS